LASKLRKSVATDLVEKGHDRREFASSASSVSSLSTSSSAGSTDFIRSPKRNLFSKFQNPVKDILDAVGVPFLNSEDTGISLKELIRVKSRQVTRKDYEVVFLGTGASIPSKYRNVSSTLINMRYVDKASGGLSQSDRQKFIIIVKPLRNGYLGDKGQWPL